MNNRISDIKNKFWSSLSNELKLLIVLSAPQKSENIDHYFLNSFDWNVFLELTERHRLLALLSDKEVILSPFMPEEIKVRFKQMLIVQKQQSLLKMNEIIKITSAFAKKTIPVLTIKGPLLALQLYGDITLRQSKDIDLMVADSDLSNCDSILKSLGYDHLFNYSTRQTEHIVKHAQHIIYTNKTLNIQLELHWDITPRKYLFPIKPNDLINHSVSVNIASCKVSTLCDEDMIMYLIIHGANHLWFRLHWLRDMAQLIITKQIDWYALLNKAKYYNIEKSVIDCILLSSIVYDTPIPEGIENNFDHVSRWRIILPLEEIKKKPYVDHRSLNIIIKKSLYRLQLRNNLKYRLNIIPTLNTKKTDWDVIHLPDRFFFLYYFLHPFIWLFYGKKKK